ncbi:MAG: nucleotide exchange factor GrpE [Hyphomonadaceae bacterium]|nr:nucleotide exchange factor GrpE [Hyphomonadaceae bacterium]
MTDETSSAGGTDDDAILAAENEGMDEAIGHPKASHAVNILAEQVSALEKERDELKNNMLRALAETDNVRKRANRQIDDARLYAVEKFARDLLNVSDNLARAVESVPPESRGDMTDAVKTALEGVDLTQKEMVSVLARHGVTAIDAAPGAAFDPALHQAVTQIPSEHPAGSVAQLFQTGWRIGDRTLRAAMVAVSAGGGKSN